MAFGCRIFGLTLVSSLLLAAPAGAARLDKGQADAEPEAEAEDAEAEPKVLTSLDCPVLFGDEATHAHFAAHRALALRWVAEQEHTVTLVHSTDWSEPSNLQYEGLELVDAQPGAAWLELPTAAASELDCPAGRYRIEVDDAIGPSGQVLAILDGVVLINEDGTLGAWQPEGAPELRWQLAWTSTWGLSRPFTGRSVSRARKAPVPRPRK